MSSSISREELEYFIDLAMNESQRWIETVTRERFLDEDDFLYSLRHGTHLRKLLNKIHPGSFSLKFSYGHQRDDEASCSGECSDLEEDSTRCANVRITYTLEECTDYDEESWIQAFLRICRTVLGIPPQRLFRPSDLDSGNDDSGSDGCLPTETLDKIRRVVVTIGELARLYEASLERGATGVGGPRIDKSALELLIRYHDHLWLIGQENDHCLSAYSSPRIKRTASTRDSAAARRKAAANLSHLSTTSLDNEDDDTDFRSGHRTCSYTAPTRHYIQCSDADSKMAQSTYDSQLFCETDQNVHSPMAGNEDIAPLQDHQSVYASIQLTNDNLVENEQAGNGLTTTDVECNQSIDFLEDQWPRDNIFQQRDTTEQRQRPKEQQQFECPDQQRQAEIPLQVTTATAVDGTGGHDLGTPLTSVSATTSPHSPFPNVAVKSDQNTNRCEKRTVRSMKNNANREHAKLVRRPSTGIITPSAATNPLKYVQAKSDLDLRARELLEKAEQDKQKRAKLRIEEKEQEWAADLENWKLRRSSSMASVRKQKTYDDDTGIVDEENKDSAKPDFSSDSLATSITGSLETNPNCPSQREQRRLIDRHSPGPETVGTKWEKSALHRTSCEANGGSGSTPTRLPISTNNGDTGRLSTSAGSLRNGAHPNESSPLQQSKSTYSDNTTSRRTNATSASVKKRTGQEMSTEMKETPVASDKFAALRSVYNNAGDEAYRSRVMGNTTERSIMTPVFAKIPTAEETAVDSGVDSYRPESLTPSRDSHDSLSPGSQGSGDRSSTRKSSVDQGDLGLKLRNNGFPNQEPNRALYKRSTEGTAKEFFVTLEKRGKGDKGFGFVLKGGYEKGEPVTVDNIAPGGAADKSGVRIGDELLEIDGMDVARAYLAMINATISQSSKAGSLELKLRRINDGFLTAEGNPASNQRERKENTEERSFDQKRLHFEKAASSEQRTFPAKPPLRRQCDSRRSSSSNAKQATSPSPINRQQYESANVGQVVARYAGEDEARRSYSHERGREAARKSPDSPYSQRRQNPEKGTDFLPDTDRSPSPSSPRRFATSTSSSDYRVTSLDAKRTPGNILNFVPESERSNGTSQAVGGESLAKRKNVLEDRDEIDQRWRRERERILGIREGTQQSQRPEPTRNFALDSISTPATQAHRNSVTDEHPPIASPCSPLSSASDSAYQQASQDTNSSDKCQGNAASSKESGVSGSLLDHPRPFTRVKPSPMTFPCEPLVGRCAELQDNRGALKDQSNAAMNPPRIKDERVDDPKLDTELASRKLDDLLKKQRQATEMDLKYLELAASAAASGVDVQQYGNGKNDRLTALSDIHQHWLVREAEDMRLSEQLREREKSDSDMVKHETRRHSTATPPSTVAGAQKGVKSQSNTNLSSVWRPPSPKYPGRSPSDINTTLGSSRYEMLPLRQHKALQDTMDEQQVVAVSAAQRCSHCDAELGRGAAMVIESLKLFFHLTCFKCYVCGTVLSDGAQGADVRVRAKKLHCQRCYSNDDTGLQFSEV